MPDLSFATARGRLRGYLAVPDGEGPWPGVVVVHEAFGLTDDIRAQADRFAAHGYLALAPDLYSYGFAPRCLVATFRTLLGGGGGRAIEDLDAAREDLVGREDCTGKVGVIGFCMGGGFALLVAARGYAAAAPHYGQLPRHLDAVLRGSCPVVASYGRNDPTMRGAGERLDRALTDLGVEHDVEVYGGAGHGFMFRRTGRWAWVDRVPNMSYSAEAADPAWQRVFAFFGRHLAD